MWNIPSPHRFHPFSLRSPITYSNYNPQELRELRSRKERGGGGNKHHFSPSLKSTLCLPLAPTWPASHTQVTAPRTAQGREAGRDPGASYLRSTAASPRLEKKSLEARARRGEARPPRLSRGLPQRPPSNRRRSSGRATAPSRQHHLILRGCRGPAPPGRREGGGRPARSPTSLRG